MRGGAFRRHHPPHGRLFWRVYLNGILLLLLVAAALGAVAWAYGGGQAPHPERFAAYAASQVAAGLGQPDRLAEGLARAREAFGVSLSVYDGERLLASNCQPPLPPLPAGERPGPGDEARRLHGGHGWRFAAPVQGAPGTYVLLSAGWRPLSAGRAASLLGAVLLALAIASIPLARGIAAPLERLTGAARRLGEGDLSARAGFAGKGEVGLLAAAFDEMAERVERLVRSERELLANVSHELRTPLARIRVAVDLASEGDLPAARRYLGEIGTDLAELTRLVEDVLTAARLDAGWGGELPLRRQRVAAREILERAAERFRALAPDRVLELAAGDELPELDADPALLRRALDNLLDNARKYSEAPAPVRLTARVAADGGFPGFQGLEIEVRDTGMGIDPADLPRLFTPFFRSDRSRARGTGGVGLGLALARRIVLAHGGTIAVESAPGQGTAVRLRVPAAT